MSEATEDQENAGAAAAQGSRAQAPKAAKTKRKKKRGGKHRKKVDKAGQNATNKGIKDARILAAGAGGIQGIVAAMQFHGLEEPSVVQEGTKALNWILKGKAGHQKILASLGLEGELFAGVEQ